MELIQMPAHTISVFLLTSTILSIANKRMLVLMHFFQTFEAENSQEFEFNSASCQLGSYSV